jgi:hypothetical protein
MVQYSTLQGDGRICAKARLAAGVDEATASLQATYSTSIRGRSSLWSKVSTFSTILDSYEYQASGCPAWGPTLQRSDRLVSKHSRATHLPPDSFISMRLLLRALSFYCLRFELCILSLLLYCRPPSEGRGRDGRVNCEETLFGGIPLRPAREAHDAQGRHLMKQF